MKTLLVVHLNNILNSNTNVVKIYTTDEVW